MFDLTTGLHECIPCLTALSIGSGAEENSKLRNIQTHTPAWTRGWLAASQSYVHPQQNVAQLAELADAYVLVYAWDMSPLPFHPSQPHPVSQH